MKQYILSLRAGKLPKMAKKAPTIEDIKKRIDLFCEEAQNNKSCGQLSVEINIANGGISKSFISYKTGIEGEDKQGVWENCNP